MPKLHPNPPQAGHTTVFPRTDQVKAKAVTNTRLGRGVEVEVVIVRQCWKFGIDKPVQQGHPIRQPKETHRETSLSASSPTFRAASEWDYGGLALESGLSHPVPSMRETRVRSWRTGAG